MFCTTLLFVPEIEAKGRKGKSVASPPRSKGSRRVVKNLRKNRRLAGRFAPAESDYAVVPDQIEVLEYGSSRSSELAQLINPSRTSVQVSYTEPDLTIQPKQRTVRIEPYRVIQIQQALAREGFHSGEMSGQYDVATVDAMRRFQAVNKIAATGYPTAAALKRLGLTNW
jgi:hypothetical protein